VRYGFTALPASIAGVLLGGLAGAINGAVITRLRVPPIIATLAMMNVARGAVLAFTGGYPVSGIIGSFAFIGRGFIGPVPVPVVLIALLYLVGFLLLEKTVFGVHLYGVGGNEQASILAGVSADRIKLMVYTLSGVTAAITGLVMTSRLGSGQPLAGQGLELDAIAAAVIGGISVLGGEGKILGTLIGSLIIAVLNNGLDLLGVGSYYQMGITGLVIVAAVSASVKQSSMK
jgi:ribose transport system permease protein